MKLYKYVSMEAAIKILENNTIGFSEPKYFNDPFDLPIATPIATDNPVDGVIADFGARAKSHIWGSQSAILSLTRTYTNQLMWAHYADSHEGAVIAFDAKTAGFLDEESNLIPAHFGSVVYKRHRDVGDYYSKPKEGLRVGATHRFVVSHYEKLQRLFLTKPIDWAYEEEVRVVKCIADAIGEDRETESGRFSTISVRDRPLHAFHLQPNAITDIILGARAEKSAEIQIRKANPSLTLHRCCIDQDTYTLNATSG